MELKNIIEEIRNRGLTAYEIAKETTLTEAGINKILNGQSKRPHKGTIDILKDYLYSTKATTNTVTSEPSSKYQAKSEIERKFQGITNEEIAHIIVSRFDELMMLNVFRLLIEREVWKKEAEIKEKAYREVLKSNF